MVQRSFLCQRDFRSKAARGDSETLTIYNYHSLAQEGRQLTFTSVVTHVMGTNVNLTDTVGPSVGFLPLVSFVIR